MLLPATTPKGPGLLRGGFWRVGEERPGSEGFPRDDYSGTGETVVYTGHHHGTFNTEPRIASYVGIAERYLALDQGMSIAALANTLLRGRLRRYMTPTLQASLEPLMRLEQFSAGWEVVSPELAR